MKAPQSGKDKELAPPPRIKACGVGRQVHSDVHPLPCS
jgi:hypothetical protein